MYNLYISLVMYVYVYVYVYRYFNSSKIFFSSPLLQSRVLEPSMG